MIKEDGIISKILHGEIYRIGIPTNNLFCEV